MENGSHINSAEKLFSSTEEELAYLRERVAKQEAVLSSKGAETIDREELILNELKAYVKEAPEDKLAKGYRMLEPHQQAIVLDLPPENHDENMAELFGILEEKGIHNALSIVEKMNNPHIEDDFHRFLVGFVKKGYAINKLKNDEELSLALHRTLFEITLPAGKKDEQQKALKELLSKMEQFYAGMLSISESQTSGAARNSISIELSVSHDSQEFIFYVSVPDVKRDLFEKQILSIFTDAKIIERKDDYNIFNSDGVTAASIGTFSNRPIYPIKTYDQFDYDPLNVTLNAFSKLSHEGEGAALQIVFAPAGEKYSKPFKHALDQLLKMVPTKEATDITFGLADTIKHELAAAGKGLLKDLFTSKAAKDEQKERKEREKRVDDIAVEQVKLKISSPTVMTNIRLISSASNRARAEEIISDVEASFGQYQNTSGNSLVFKRVLGSETARLMRDFSFRLFEENAVVPLNLKELTSLMHFPESSIINSGQLKEAKSGTAPAPLDIPKKGIYLGKNIHRNMEVPIYMSPEDRLRHFYLIGQTGTGKTTLLKNMILQDIQNGEGVCFIDPHGSDVQDILARIPKERFEDVIYFDPSHVERPMAMNMLEYDPAQPEQKTFVVNELFSIFDKLFDMKTAGGPMFEQYFRNATMLVLEDPESGNTLLDVSRVLASKTFRDLKLSKCKNPIVLQFWKEIAEKAGGESSLANIVPYITSKFDVFLANDIMRPLIVQERSSFNFRDIMDNKKILLVNLSKGKLGDINASLIGLILVGKILMAALSRVDQIGAGLKPFYLYIDEFQNVTTNSISVILSEARKYKLSLHIAHQFIAQLKDDIKNAVFGNVGSMITYRVGSEDAEFLQKQFQPTFEATDIMNLDNFNGYAKLLVNGKPTRPFNLEADYLGAADTSKVEPLKQLSYLKYGKDRAEIEAIITEKYKKEPPKIPTESPFKKALDPFANLDK